MIKESIAKIVRGDHLTEKEMNVVMGDYDPESTMKMARVLKRLGTREAFVAAGLDGEFNEGKGRRMP